MIVARRRWGLKHLVAIGALLLGGGAGCRSSGPDARTDAGASEVRTPRGPRSIGARVIDDNEIALMSAYCHWQLRCGRRLHGDGSFADCVDYLTTASTAEWQSDVAVLAAIRAGKAHLDEEGWRMCLEGLSAQSCGVSLGGGNLFRTALCARAVVGTTAEGERCIVDQQCGAGLACIAPFVSEDGVCGGTCQPATGCQRASDCGVGLSCSFGTCRTTTRPGDSDGASCGTEVACGPGLSCDSLAGEGGVCRAIPSLGEACRSGLPCDGSNVVCVLHEGSFLARCQLRKEVGEPCSDFFDCAGVGGDEYCDSSTQRCVAAPRSGPCGERDTCDDTVAFCNNGTCQPYGKAGDACSGEESCGYPFVHPDLACRPGGNGDVVCSPVLADPCVP